MSFCRYSYHLLIDITRGNKTLRAASTAHVWDRIVRDQQTGIDAAVAILETLTVEANVLLGELERFTATCEQVAYDQALNDALDVTEGTHDQDPHQPDAPREEGDASDVPRTGWHPDRIGCWLPGCDGAVEASVRSGSHCTPTVAGRSRASTMTQPRSSATRTATRTSAHRCTRP
ncbi:hypothetical protein ACFQ07_34160 [Actinomadura adrarensis]|uniref:Uncharacterized protein n=1 Tax=Actinomadura adrarensis TaxID=1819600 RepID=A0ABW3CVB2_9ACTN